MSYQLFLSHKSPDSDLGSNKKIPLNKFLLYVEHNPSLDIIKLHDDFYEVRFLHESFRENDFFIFSYEAGDIRTVSRHVTKESLELLLDMSRSFKVDLRSEENEILTSKDLETVGTYEEWSKQDLEHKNSFAKQQLHHANIRLLRAGVIFFLCITALLVPGLIVIGLLCIVPVCRNVKSSYKGRSTARKKYAEINLLGTTNSKSYSDLK
jgi:hypothetical protein